MTRVEFYHALSQMIAGGDWRAVVFGEERRCLRLLPTYGSMVGYCPITAVVMHETGEFYEIQNYDLAAGRIGLKNYRIVAFAADSDSTWEGPRSIADVRRKLSRVLQIKEDTLIISSFQEHSER